MKIATALLVEVFGSAFFFTKAETPFRVKSQDADVASFKRSLQISSFLQIPNFTLGSMGCEFIQKLNENDKFVCVQTFSPKSANFTVSFVSGDCKDMTLPQPDKYNIN